MAVEATTDTNIKDSINNHSGKLVIIDFWAEWCGPCKMLAPTLTALSEAYSDSVVIFKLNIDENSQAAQEYEITSIPCCIFFKEGKEVHRVVGFKTKDAFEQDIKSYT